MKFTLRDFQKKYVRELLDELNFAKSELSKKYQAITLSAPTASGKTVMMTSLIERVLFGKGSLEEFDDPEFPIESDAVFLWLSDSPQLNRQSLEKMSAAASAELIGRLQTVEANFDAEFFMPGSIYFLNSQKLSVAGLLTNKEKGDLRNFTIWETINNTILRQKNRFYVVIDEAHRGMRRTQNEQMQAMSIIQKFIFGSPDEVNPSPIVIGVSATPERFDASLSGGSRTRRGVDIPAQEARDAGLIKDFILMSHKDEDHPTEWTLLTAACQEFQKISDEWSRYCTANEERDIVRPILVIQIEDSPGAGSALESRTSLTKLVEVVRENIPNLVSVNFSHCLESGKTIKVADLDIRYVEPHRIEYDEAVRVVIFKMALSTGWDCPRAEVMMSFRRAEDATYIAQLVGRIVRTPLARRMVGNDLLNSVMLFLPFFERENVQSVVDKLQGDGGESKGGDAGVQEDFQTLTVSSGNENLLKAYEALPTYTTEDGRRVTDLRRGLRLAFEFAFDGWEKDSLSIRNGLLTKLLSVGEERRKHASFSKAIQEVSNVTYRMLRVENGVIKPDDLGEERTLLITEQDIDNVFSRSFVTLTEELARSYVSSRYDQNDPNALFWRCKLELFLLSQDESVVTELEKTAQNLVETIYEKRKPDINKSPLERQAAYKRIFQSSRHFTATEPLVPTPMRVKTDRAAESLDQHLFTDGNGRFKAKLNSWESTVLTASMRQEGFASWLRNYPRKPWSIAYTYQSRGEIKPGYPDFVVFRNENGNVIVDLLEPHEGADALEKIHGLCRFAEKHGHRFGRVEWIKIEGSQIKRLNVNLSHVRKTVLATNVDSALATLFNTVGTAETASVE